MKSIKPYQLIFIGSVLVGLIGFLAMYLFLAPKAQLELELMIVIAFGIGLLCFFIFQILITKFISNKIKILYRTIRKGKLHHDDPNITIYGDILDQAAKDTNEWALERNKEISKLKEQAAFRKEFLGNLAHELKTPIFSIQGYILTLLEGGLEDENVNRKFLERASKATDRIASILDDLDSITKMEVDRVEFNFKNFDIVDLAEEVMESLEIPSQEKNIRIAFNKKYDPIYVNADRNKIAQVLTNLISNSIFYGNENGKTIIRFFPLEDAIMCEVADDGPGIEEEKLPRIFERFYRVEQSRNRNEGGSGLGLSIVKHIIESHNQSINVRSTKGLGSTFSFTLARARNQRG
ncbi:two-component system, OmpR family, phosphate regulon sensor histidine kinase PhoR [Lishizhenia tianjinensis]|uniref:histidine kinase n=1 Tax=Lishizhenia tianjinensis TaxID=477690 RepID=A0A1I6ZZR0_9FLAO|nr:ATP-binding protein [Lishizhenia tianjinensis]SFT68117.1 two-component system, OmpR family, phosphate regulon sensor histidine kinase PhoR [Lishizhenia tianjinensis]